MIAEEVLAREIVARLKSTENYKSFHQIIEKKISNENITKTGSKEKNQFAHMSAKTSKSR